MNSAKLSNFKHTLPQGKKEGLWLFFLPGRLWQVKQFSLKEKNVERKVSQQITETSPILTLDPKKDCHIPLLWPPHPQYSSETIVRVRHSEKLGFLNNP